MAKGASNAAQSAYGQDKSNADYFTGQGKALSGTLTPFLENELHNPQGLGAEEESKMLTDSGQSIAGATGAAGEQARLAASRTGNPAATAGVIDATARNAMRQNSTNALDIDNQDAMLRQKQQQAGVSGLSSLYGEDTSAALKSLGLEDESINAWTGADKANPWASVGPTIATSWLSRPGSGALSKI